MLDLAAPHGAGAPLLDGAGPADGAAAWIAAGDGTRLRAVAWGRDAPRGTALIFQGRAEYAEKYARVAADLRARGFASATVDWRGQGLSDRPAARRGPERGLGDVERWGDYQADVAALVAWAGAEGLPRPWFLLAHSMGGAIGLRALHDGLPVAAAAFSAPLWGFSVAALKPSALRRALAGDEERAGATWRDLVAGRRQAEPYVLWADFAGNALTSDREAFDWLRGHVRRHPELGTGAPTLRWVNEAARELARLAWLGPPAGVPALALVGTEEAVVDAPTIRRRMAAWPGARFVVLPGARHEPLMEVPTVRARAIEEVAGLFGGAA